MRKYKNDPEWERVRSEVWKRDAGFVPGKGEAVQKNWKAYCRVWKILTVEEQEQVFIIGNGDLWINQNLDVSHIKGRGSNADLKYDIDNLVLTGRYFANLLDTRKSPVTRKSITPEEHEKWWERIRNGNIQH